MGDLTLIQPVQVLISLSCGALAIGFVFLSFGMVMTRAILGSWAQALKEWD